MTPPFEQVGRSGTKTDSVLATPPVPLLRVKERSALRACEKVALAYFTYLPCLGLIRRLRTGQVLLLGSIPLALWAVCQAQSRSTSRTVAILRDWWPLSWILVGYWAMGWLASPPLGTLQIELAGLDRLLLNNTNLQGLIEAPGPLFPVMLETVYLLLYAIPPICLGILYSCRERSQAPRFLLIVFAGTFTAYALLPYVPVISPRVAFPSADLPHYGGMARTVNTWLLDHLDISTGVLPSGHVAVAFSSALAMADVLRARPWFGRCALGGAGLVFVATVYGRYHYSVDGLISIALVSVISRFTLRVSHA